MPAPRSRSSRGSRSQDTRAPASSASASAEPIPVAVEQVPESESLPESEQQQQQQTPKQPHVCRYCLGTAEDKAFLMRDAWDKELITPCKCTSFIHRGCLHKWRETNRKSCQKCSECLSPFEYAMHERRTTAALIKFCSNLPKNIFSAYKKFLTTASNFDLILCCFGVHLIVPTLVAVFITGVSLMWAAVVMLVAAISAVAQFIVVMYKAGFPVGAAYFDSMDKLVHWDELPDALRSALSHTAVLASFLSCLEAWYKWNKRDKRQGQQYDKLHLDAVVFTTHLLCIFTSLKSSILLSLLLTSASVLANNYKAIISKGLAVKHFPEVAARVE